MVHRDRSFQQVAIAEAMKDASHPTGPLPVNEGQLAYRRR